jgi:hypothetical protein
MVLGHSIVAFPDRSPNPNVREGRDLMAPEKPGMRIPRKPVTDSISSRSRFHGKPVGGGGRVADRSVAGSGQSIWLVWGSLAGGSFGVV